MPTLKAIAKIALVLGLALPTGVAQGGRHLQTTFTLMSMSNGNTTVYDVKRMAAPVAMPPGFPWKCSLVTPAEAANPKLLGAGFICFQTGAGEATLPPAVYVRASCKVGVRDSSSSTADLAPSLDGLGGKNDRSVTLTVLCTTA